MNLGNTSGDPGWKQNIKDYNAASGIDVNGRYQGFTSARYLIPAEFAHLVKQYATQAGLDQASQDALLQYMEYATHPERMSEENRQRLFSSVPQLTQQLQNQIASAGGGQAAKEGAAVSVFNNARRASNDFDANLFSPSGRANTALGVVNVANAANPNLNNLGALHGIELGTPRNQSGLQAAGGIVGGLVNNWLSPGSGLFSGASGGSRPPSGGINWGESNGGGYGG